MIMYIFSDLKNCELFLGEIEKVENLWVNRFVFYFYIEYNINNQIIVSNIYFVYNGGDLYIFIDIYIIFFREFILFEYIFVVKIQKNWKVFYVRKIIQVRIQGKVFFFIFDENNFCFF